MNHYSQVVRRLDAELFPARRRTALMQAARRFIDRHHDQAIDLSVIAARACLSEYHFIRQFQKYYGQTPCQHLRQVRIRHAQHLLMQGRCVTDVCLAVGYTSVSSFSLLFTRMTGLAPSRYRKAILDKRAERPVPIIDRWNAARRFTT